MHIEGIFIRAADQEVRKGFTWGSVTIVPLLEDEEEEPTTGTSSTSPGYASDDRLIIPFQNENLYAYIEKPNGDKKVNILFPDSNSTTVLTYLTRFWSPFRILLLSWTPKTEQHSGRLTTGEMHCYITSSMVVTN